MITHSFFWRTSSGVSVPSSFSARIRLAFRKKKRSRIPATSRHRVFRSLLAIGNSFRKLRQTAADHRVLRDNQDLLFEGGSLGQSLTVSGIFPGGARARAIW